MVALRSTLCLAGGDKVTHLSEGRGSVSFNLLENAVPLLPVWGEASVSRGPGTVQAVPGAGTGREEDVPRRNAQSSALGTARDRYSCRASAPPNAAMGERCCRVPGDAAGPTVASMKKFNQQHWLRRPAMLLLRPCPAYCPLTPCTAPARAHPSLSPLRHAGLLQQRAGAGSEGAAHTLPGCGDAAGSVH